jgi:hypothetical protein
VDLALHLRVIWRFKYLVAGGLLLAILLSVLAMARVDFGGGMPRLAYRKPEIWSGTAKLLLTQQGLPYGRLTLPATNPGTTTPTTTTTTGSTSGSSSGESAPVYADPARLTSLAPFYAQLANSDAVQRHLPPGAVRASAVVDTSTPYATVLPIVQFTALGTSPKRANALAAAAAFLFRHYMVQQQNQAGISQNERVLLQTLNAPTAPVLLQGRKKTVPILAFATVLIATLGLAFVLENLRPQLPSAGEGSDDEDQPVDERLMKARAGRA